MTRRRMRSFPLSFLLLPVAAACGGSSGETWSFDRYAPAPQHDPWSHRSSFGGGDLSVGGDGNGFHYFIDSSGTSWSGGG